MVGKILLILLDKYFLKLFAIMQTANMVENKQCQFKFNNFIDEISTIHLFISHLLSSLEAIRIFSGSTRFSSTLLYGWFHPVLSISGMDPGIFFVFWNTTMESRLVFCSYPSLYNNAWVMYFLRLAIRHVQ